jgi:hypothetical protein
VAAGSDGVADGLGKAGGSGDRKPVRGHSLCRLALAALLATIVAGAIGVKVGGETLVRSRDGMVAALEQSFAREVSPAPTPSSRPVAAPRLSPAAFDAFADMPDELRAALTSSEPSGSQPFRFLVAVPPPTICEGMAGAGLVNPGWTAMGDEWQCASDLVTVPGSVPVAPDPGSMPEGIDEGEIEARPSTLYFVARGPAEDRLGLVRFKLNLDDPSVDRVGRDMLLSALQRLSGPLAWSMPDTVVEAIRRHRKLSMFDRGVGVEVHPETGPVRRLNVVLLLDTPSTRLPTDRFDKMPREILETLAR